MQEHVIDLNALAPLLHQCTNRYIKGTVLMEAIYLLQACDNEREMLVAYQILKGAPPHLVTAECRAELFTCLMQRLGHDTSEAVNEQYKQRMYPVVFHGTTEAAWTQIKGAGWQTYSEVLARSPLASFVELLQRIHLDETTVLGPTFRRDQELANHLYAATRVDVAFDYMAQAPEWFYEFVNRAKKHETKCCKALVLRDVEQRFSEWNITESQDLQVARHFFDAYWTRFREAHYAVMVGIRRRGMDEVYERHKPFAAEVYESELLAIERQTGVKQRAESVVPVSAWVELGNIVGDSDLCLPKEEIMSTRGYLIPNALLQELYNLVCDL